MTAERQVDSQEGLWPEESIPITISAKPVMETNFNPVKFLFLGSAYTFTMYT
jgi:hypothetical protein